MPGSDRAMRVGGAVIFTTEGYSAELRKKEGPGRINPLMLELDVVVTSPSGKVVPEVLTVVELEPLTNANPTIEYEQVSFRLVGVDNQSPPDTIDVVHTQQI